MIGAKCRTERDRAGVRSTQQWEVTLVCTQILASNIQPSDSSALWSSIGFQLR